MTSIVDPPSLVGRTAVGSDGNKVGKIGKIYLDDQTGEPTWVTVATGLFGAKQFFAPLRGASESGDAVTLSVPKDLIKDAPNVEDAGHLKESEQSALYDHYARFFTGRGTRVGGETTGAGHDTSGPNTDQAMTRSEERLHVGTEQVESGHVRLRKYVVTENVTQTVPVSHEEVWIEREPITDANRDAATSGAEISEEEHEATLHAERPVVAKETVPVERVKLGTETVTEQHQVDEEIRKEQIDVDDEQVTRDARR